MMDRVMNIRDIEIVMNALAGCPMVTTAKFADKIEFALQKQISKQVVKSPKYNSDRCPKCDKVVYISQHYCSQCGQKLDWRS